MTEKGAFWLFIGLPFCGLVYFGLWRLVAWLVAVAIQ